MKLASGRAHVDAQDDGWFIRTRSLPIAYVCAGCLCLLLSAAGVFGFGARLAAAKLSGKRWCGAVPLRIAALRSHASLLDSGSCNADWTLPPATMVRPLFLQEIGRLVHPALPCKLAVGLNSARHMSGAAPSSHAILLDSRSWNADCTLPLTTASKHVCCLGHYIVSGITGWLQVPETGILCHLHLSAAGHPGDASVVQMIWALQGACPPRCIETVW